MIETGCQVAQLYPALRYRDGISPLAAGSLPLNDHGVQLRQLPIARLWMMDRFTRTLRY
jgi:hypothetical protein